MVSTITNTAKSLDDMSLQFRNGVVGLYDGFDKRDSVTITEALFGTANSVTTLSYYLTAIPNGINRISQLFKLHVAPVAAFAITISNKIPLTHLLFGLGWLASSFRFCKESLSLYRQQQFLSIFYKHAWQESKVRNTLKDVIANFDKQTFKQSLPSAFLKEIETRGGKAYLERLLKQPTIAEADALISQWTGNDIRDALEEIKNLPDPSLERSLPVWLFEDITHKGGKEYLNLLLKKVYKGDRQATAESTKLLETMRTYAAKKKILHILGMTAAVIGIISSVGFLVAFPLALTIVLMVLMVVFGTAAFAVRKGYVENRDGNFSFNKLLPEFLQQSNVSSLQLTPQNLAYVPMKKQSKRRCFTAELRSSHFQRWKRPLQHAS
jgi:hypothetical protein